MAKISLTTFLWIIDKHFTCDIAHHNGEDTIIKNKLFYDDDNELTPQSIDGQLTHLHVLDDVNEPRVVVAPQQPSLFISKISSLPKNTVIYVRSLVSNKIYKNIPVGKTINSKYIDIDGKFLDAISK